MTDQEFNYLASFSQPPEPDYNTGPDLVDKFPALVAYTWKFKLAYRTENGETFYNVRHWLAGMVDDKYAAQAVRNMRRPGGLLDKETSVFSIHTSPEPDKYGRLQPAYYVNEVLLYRITMDVRTTEKRAQTILEEVKMFLANSGALVGKAMTDPHGLSKVLGEAMIAHRARLLGGKK